MLFSYSRPTFLPLLTPTPYHPTPTESISYMDSHGIVHAHDSANCVLCLPYPSLSPITLHPVPSGHCQFVLYFHVSGSIFHTCSFSWLWYGIYLSPPGLFHLALCSPDPSMLSWRVGAPSFFLLHGILLCKCTTVFLSTHLLMGT